MRQSSRLENVGRSPGFLLLCASVALGQGFSGLATNQDGSVLYFSSAARMKGTSQYFHSKIFRWDATLGISLFEQRPDDFPYPAVRPPFGVGSTFFALFAPDISSDGSVLAFIGSRNCWGNSSCLHYDLKTQTSVYALADPTAPPTTLPGLGALSPNGRYLVVSDPFYISVPITVLDLQTGQTTQYNTGGGLRSAPKRWVANDGTIVFTTADGLALAKDTQVQPIPRSGDAWYGMVNDSATLLLFEHSGVLSVYSLKDGASRDLASTTPPQLAGTRQFGAAMSYDGSEIAFIYGGDRQVYVIHSDGTGLRQLTHLPGPVIEVALSGDGTSAFAVTADNSLVRIDSASGSVSEIIPATPWANGYNESSRGSLRSINGSGFATQPQQAAAPYPLALNGVELRIGAVTPIPLASVTPTLITYGVPWDLPDSRYDVEIWVAAFSNSPFVPGFEAAPAAPSFALRSGIHEDFSALINQANPARPGEIVHLYAYDLGPVSPVPPFGAPAPSQPLSTLADLFACYISAPYSRRSQLDVLFAGLAPTLLNVFQVDVRLPTSFASNSGYIQCHIGDPTAGYDVPGLGPTVWLSSPAVAPN
jgi:uncharacterized protein (TIGR03437 family)